MISGKNCFQVFQFIDALDFRVDLDKSVEDAAAFIATLKLHKICFWYSMEEITTKLLPCYFIKWSQQLVMQYFK